MTKDIVRAGSGVRANSIKFARPIIGPEEIAAVGEALKNPRMTNAGRVVEFESQFSEMIGGGAAVAMSSCTSALHAALLCLDIGQDDEVIVPALTFAACAHVVEAVGAIPVFADCHPEAGQLDPEAVERCVTKRTKAIMLMHYAGRAGYIGTMQAVARRHNLRIIEDCATALGAVHSGKHVGLHGDIGCFSFHPVKHITTGEGGMLVTRNLEVAARARAFREFGKWVDTDQPHSYVDYEIRGFGLNFRMTEMQAAIGLVQLKSAKHRLELRRWNYRKLAAMLDGLEILQLGGDEAAAYCLVVHMPDMRSQFAVRKALAKRGVETSCYYPGPLPLMPYYAKKYDIMPGSFPSAERIAHNTIAMSVGPHLSAADMVFQAEQLKEVLK